MYGPISFGSNPRPSAFGAKVYLCIWSRHIFFTTLNGLTMIPIFTNKGHIFQHPFALLSQTLLKILISFEAYILPSPYLLSVKYSSYFASALVINKMVSMNEECSHHSTCTFFGEYSLAQWTVRHVTCQSNHSPTSTIIETPQRYITIRESATRFA